MSSVLARAAMIWFVIVVLAVLNGIFREKVLVPATGVELALPLSGITLAVLVFLAALASVTFIGPSSGAICLQVGLLWLVLTLGFEFLFGRCVAGRSWQEILQVFNVRKGDLFVMVLIVTTISPWLAAKARGLL